MMMMMPGHFLSHPGRYHVAVCQVVWPADPAHSAAPTCCLRRAAAVGAHSLREWLQERLPSPAAASPWITRRRFSLKPVATDGTTGSQSCSAGSPPLRWHWTCSATFISPRFRTCTTARRTRSSCLPFSVTTRGRPTWTSPFPGWTTRASATVNATSIPQISRTSPEKCRGKRKTAA